jgi:hypothetical protein
MSQLTIGEAINIYKAIEQGKSLPTLNGRLVKSSTKYIAGLAATLGQDNGQLILAKMVPEVGVTNLPKGNMLPAGVNYLVTGVRVLFDTTTAVTVATATWKSEAPANWKNGELKIAQNGTGNVFETSITDVSNWKASTSNDDDFRSIMPVLLKSDTAYEIQVSLAAGSTANQAYKVELRVVEIIENGQN